MRNGLIIRLRIIAMICDETPLRRVEASWANLAWAATTRSVLMVEPRSTSPTTRTASASLPRGGSPLVPRPSGRLAPVGPGAGERLGRVFLRPVDHSRNPARRTHASVTNVARPLLRRLTHPGIFRAERRFAHRNDP